MKGTPFKLKQKLSPVARKAKHDRDVLAAKTPVRRRKKKENQAIGQNGTTDLHHTTGVEGPVKRVSIENNRGNYGRGTKNR